MRIGPGPTPRDVTLNGELLSHVLEVCTFGNPAKKPRLGFVKVAVLNGNGHVFIAPDGDRVATSWLFGRVHVLERVTA